MKDMVNYFNTHNEGLEKHVVVYKEKVIANTQSKGTESIQSHDKVKKINNFIENLQNEEQSSLKQSVKEGSIDLGSPHE